jgi:hypothetical protein
MEGQKNRGKGGCGKADTTDKNEKDKKGKQISNRDKKKNQKGVASSDTSHVVAVPSLRGGFVASNLWAVTSAVVLLLCLLLPWAVAYTHVLLPDNALRALPEAVLENLPTPDSLTVYLRDVVMKDVRDTAIALSETALEVMPESKQFFASVRDTISALKKIMPGAT